MSYVSWGLGLEAPTAPPTVAGAVKNVEIALVDRTYAVALTPRTHNMSLEPRGNEITLTPEQEALISAAVRKFTVTLEPRKVIT